MIAVVVYGALIALRRRAPASRPYSFVALVFVLALFLTPPPHLQTVFFGLLLFGYVAGPATHGVRRPRLPAGLLAGDRRRQPRADTDAAGDWIFPSALGARRLLSPAATCVLRAALAAELHEAALRAEEAQDDEERRAVADERRRIAREMHDVVAHSICVMVVQAGGARRILERDPERAEQAAAQIERTGRETLLEMRRLLGVMRNPDEPAELEPNPTLDDLEGLVRRAREAGLGVDAQRRGHPAAARRRASSSAPTASSRTRWTTCCAPPRRPPPRS